MGTPMGKVGWCAILASIAVGGCFKKISVDPDAIRCTVDDDCPGGYTCTALGACCRNAADPTCGRGDAAPIPDAPNLPDVAIDLGDRGGIDGSVATGGSGGTSRSGGAGGSLSGLGGTAAGLGGATIGVGGSTTSLGGMDGLGGSTGSGGAGGQIDAALDAPLDTPLGGSGGSAGVGTGGSVSSGGVIATGGVATGGSTGSGGMGTGGVLGTGGTAETCSGGATQCSGNAVQTCTSGQWGSPVPCGPRQTCTGSVGNAKCMCNADPVCTSVGGTCSSSTTLATCAQDSTACFYQSTASTCSNGACSGPAGAASCCTNACTAGSRTCASSTAIQTCVAGTDGCLALGPPALCTNGACTGPAGAASCCSNACTPGTSCVSSDTLATCAVGTDGCSVSATSLCANGSVCERIAPAECANPDWAAWPVATNQGEGGPVLVSYTDNGDGTVADNVTKLIWQQLVPVTTYVRDDAAAYCATLTLAGRSDWRLPTVIELMSIVDQGRSGPSINGTHFPGTPDGGYWTSTAYAGDPLYGWLVGFYSGGPGGGYTTNTGHVRCVR